VSTELQRIITKKELRLLVPYTPQHIGRLEKKGKFPKRVYVGERRVGWWLHEILAWLAARPEPIKPSHGPGQPKGGTSPAP
jgi:prophage regulatory protein